MIKERNVAVSIILTLVTCGIYSIYWIICMTNDTKELAGDDGVDGMTAVLFGILTCGIYYIYLMYKLGERIDIIKQKNGQTSSNTGIFYIILHVIGLGIVVSALVQSELNKYAIQ